VQGLHQFLLGAVRQRSLQHCATVGPQRFHEPVDGDLADDDQQRRGTGLDQFLHEAFEIVLDSEIPQRRTRRP